MMTAKMNAATSQVGAHGARLFHKGILRQRTPALFFPGGFRKLTVKEKPAAKEKGRAPKDPAFLL